MDTNDKIVGTVLGLNEKEYRSLVKDGMSKNKAALIAAESALIFHADSEKHEIVDLTNFTTDEKENLLDNILITLKLKIVVILMVIQD